MLGKNSVNSDSATLPALADDGMRLSWTEYRALAEQAPLMIWRADLSMGCNWFNARWLAFTGRSLAQEQGAGWAEGVHPEDLQACLDTYTACFARQEPFAMEYRLRRWDGVYRWILDCGVPFYDEEEGQFQGYIGSCTDVTERREAEALLRQEHAREVQRLYGLLPICAGCKKIKDDRGEWNQLEAYLCSHSEVAFTHGYCPDCARRFREEAAGWLKG